MLFTYIIRLLILNILVDFMSPSQRQCVAISGKCIHFRPKIEYLTKTATVISNVVHIFESQYTQISILFHNIVFVLADYQVGLDAAASCCSN